ncbi:hypothetical protein VE01_06631 [Pseudogymnoascus verrucosus]|uniref:HTH La-type RNA-binding domain-containing protein n=1 Tax=Pseudogymnoascus verrucosus TaxID=342668 RepID=A0A1B8GHV4_9PEZI|nr:uncharacterized protein VE01_06631 [Pseudogymnoascus verrucosus]OBT95375.1 hypothetical protein VE01_06631 [Pseudogymnoascus verrucosus]
MTTTATTRESAAAFSYAQAAKGRAAANASLLSSQNTSGTNTPSKDMSLSVESSLDFSNTAATSDADRSTNGDADVKVPGTLASSTTASFQNSVPTSPSYGTASTSTLPREEEAAAAPKLSDSPWDRLAASETVSEKPEGDRRKTRKGKKDKNADKDAEKEKEEPKPAEILVAAPPPAVNFWQQRMASKPASEEPTAAEASTEVKPAEKRKPKADEGEKSAGPSQNGTARETKGQKKNGESSRGKEDYNKRSAPRGSRVGDKDEKAAANQLPPPVGDAVSWPTPETALEEEKRKAQEKIDKDEKDAESSANKQPRQKEKWVSVPYTPSVTFNTPLPARGARGRAGRPAGRDGGGRGGQSSNDGHGGDKTVSSENTGSDNRERGRDSNGSGRATSLPPNASKRSAGDSYRDARKPSTAEKKTESAAAKADAAASSNGRRSSIATQTESTNGPSDGARSQKNEQPNGTSDSHAHPHSAGYDMRSEFNARAGDFQKDANGHQGRERGEGRSERGRGGYRGRGNHGNFANGQQHPQQAYSNGQVQQPVNGYNMRPNGPYSPTPPSQPFPGGFPQPAQRGRSGAPPPRSQSNPNSGPMYPRYPGNPNGPPMMSPIATNGAMFDYPGMQSMSAVPYNPYVEPYSVMAMVTMQLEYYFSIDNLCKDVFLRKHMDSQGFVFLSFIAGFKRIQSLTQDFELLRYSCQESDVIEIVVGDDGVDRLRRNDGWEKWVLPIEERDEAARNKGPERFYRQSHPRGQQMPQRMMPQGPQGGPPPPFSPNGVQSFTPYAAGSPNMNGENGFVPPPMHDSPLSAAVPEFAPAPAFNPADYVDVPTTFADEEITSLTVVYSQKASGEAPQRVPYNGNSRTFSNGSIDARVIAEELQEAEKRQGRPLTNGSSESSEISPERLRNSLSPSTMSPTRLVFGNAPPVMWLKSQVDATSPPSESKTSEPYTMIRSRALSNRPSSPPADVDNDMKVLYQFWAHFLIRNFNPQMYEEFRRCAHEDAGRQAMFGMNHLVTFYDEVLNSKKRTVPEVFARHYVELVREEDRAKDRPAFAKLRAAWRNGALDMKSRKKVDGFVDPVLREELER